MLSAELKAKADNIYRDIDYSGNHKKKTNLIMVLLYIVLKKIRTNTASHGTQFDSALGNHALRAQPTDKSLIC